MAQLAGSLTPFLLFHQLRDTTSDGGLYVTHQWARNGVTASDKGLNAGEAFPWLVGKILSDQLVVLSKLPDELPPEAVKERASLSVDPVKAHITVPLRIGGIVVGGVTFAKLLNERGWSEKEVQRLKLVAEIFGNALERKRVEAEIRRLSEELRQVSQVVTMGELTASLAHELNQPLAAILNNSQAALELLAAKSPNLKEVVVALEDIVRDDTRAVKPFAMCARCFGVAKRRCRLSMSKNFYWMSIAS